MNSIQKKLKGHFGFERGQDDLNHAQQAKKEKKTYHRHRK